MPNRPDQSVKMSRRERGNSVKSYWLLGGICLAGTGALAVTLAGGQVGTMLGAAVFTVLIILQIYSLTGRTELAPGRPVEVSQSGPEIAQDTAPNRDQILIISVSDLGRVRSVWGNTDYLEGLRVGVILEKLIAPEATEDRKSVV